MFFVQTGVSAKEIATVRDLFAAGGSAFALVTLWMALSGPATAAAWACLALVWLAMAGVLQLGSFRWLAAGVLGFACARVLVVNLGFAWLEENLAERWLIPLFVIGTLYYLWLVFRQVAAYLERSVAPVFTWIAALMAVWLLGVGISRLYIVSAWALLAVGLLVAGLRLNLNAFRWQSYLILALAVVCCLEINFTESESASIFARIAGTSLLIGCLLAGEFVLPRNPGAGERHARTLASLAAIFLLTALLYHEVSGSLLTVVWGFEASACLGAGFPLRERILRLQGLGLLALCILKLFIYDLRNLETMYRILSFIALGAILLGVSLIYTRFRTQIQRYL
jgi:hypothetical protein